MDIKIINPVEKHVNQMVNLADESRQYHIYILNGYFKQTQCDIERDIIKQYMSQPEKHIIIIAVDTQDNVLGMIMGDVLYKPWLIQSDVGHVSNFIVSGKFRGQSIGKKLMDAFKSECKKRGIAEMTLGVYSKNKNAYDFYVKYGFEDIEQKMHMQI